MKIMNKQFILEFLNQLDTPKLVQVLSSLSDKEEAEDKEYIDYTEPVPSKTTVIPKDKIRKLVVEPVEIFEEISDKIDNNIVVVDKVNVVKDVHKKAQNALEKYINLETEEDFEKWLADNAKKHLEPPEPLEVPIVDDLYEKFFGKNRETPLDIIVKKIQNTTDPLTLRILKDEFKEMIEAQKASIMKQNIPKKPVKDSKYVQEQEIKRENMRKAEAQQLELSKERVKYNWPAKNAYERELDIKTRNDQFRDKINSAMFTGETVIQLPPVADIQAKNQEILKELTTKDDPLVPTVESPLLEKALNPNYTVAPEFKV